MNGMEHDISSNIHNLNIDKQQKLSAIPQSNDNITKQRNRRRGGRK